MRHTFVQRFSTRLYSRVRVDGVRGNAALVLAVHDAVVALLAPIRVPAVLDLPVGLARLGAVTDDQHGVIEGVVAAAAEERVVDAALVILHVPGVDPDDDRT